MSHRVLVIAGSREECRGFLAGVAAAKGLAWEARFSDECNVRVEGSESSILDRLFRDRARNCAILSQRFAAEVRAALVAVPAESGIELEIEEDHPVVEARQCYRFHAFSRPLAQEIRDRLAHLPAGVRIEQREEREAEDRAAKGVEAYAPEHDYTLEGSGTLVGEWPAVLAARESLATIELVHLEPLHIRVAEEDEGGAPR